MPIEYAEEAPLYRIAHGGTHPCCYFLSSLSLKISLIEILPGVIHAAELAKVTPHSTILIMGQGVSGLVLTQVFSLYRYGCMRSVIIYHEETCDRNSKCAAVIPYLLLCTAGPAPSLCYAR